MKTPISNDKLKKKKSRQPWLTRVKQVLLRGPKTREQLIQILRVAKQRQLLDAQALKMIEGVLKIADLHVRDIMIPRAKMTFISNLASLPELLPLVTESGHSRFPVIDNNTKEVIGLLLAKDLLKYNPSGQKATFNIHEIIRRPALIPESKRLDSLLEEFQHKHYHMAMVLDEYGTVSGLVTIEDVLEEIVGEIEDEYDDNAEIFVQEENSQQHIVNALMPIEAFNTYFNAEFSTEQFDTIGGFITNRFGYLPKRGASIILSSFQFKVLRANNRQISLLQVTLNKEQATQ